MVEAPPPKAFRQSMSVLHSWAGLTLGAILYFMFLTGTAGYANIELDRWMRPELPIAGAAPPAETRAVTGIGYLASNLPLAESYYLDIDDRRAGPVMRVFGRPTAAGRAAGQETVEQLLDSRTGAPLAARETGGGNALYQMHYALHYMPFDLATFIVGLATMFMLVAIITGIVIHRRIFADMFTFRPGKGQRSWLDAHNISSVLALPFMVMITYSGFLFFTFQYMQLAKTAAYGTGEVAEARMRDEVNRISAEQREARGRVASLAPIAPMVRLAEQRWGAGAVGSISIEHPGDAAALVTVGHRDSKVSRDLVAELRFDGVTGSEQASEVRISNPPRNFSRTMYTLHEGGFAGPLLRWLYIASGLLGAAMVGTGMVLWTKKRRQQLRRGAQPGAGLRFVERLNVGVIAGLPVAFGVHFWANRLLPIGMPDRAAWEMHALFIAWGLALTRGALRPADRGWREQLAAAAALFGLLPVLNAATTDIHLARTLPIGQSGDWVLASIDLTALALGLAFAGAAVKVRRPERQIARAEKRQAAHLPAE